MPARPKQLAVRGVTYTNSCGQEVHVSASEMRAVMQQLAESNGFSVAEMLANEPVKRGCRLNCLLVEQLPEGWGQDSSGYIMVRFPKASTPKGISFLGAGDGDGDADYRPRSGSRSVAAKQSQLPVDAEAEALPALPRTTGRKRTRVASYSQSSPPSEAQVGRTQRVLERYHRAAFAACVPDQLLQDGWVLHACGNKRCAKVAHFYLGDEATNALDTSYHQSKLGMSRICLPCLQ